MITIILKTLGYELVKHSQPVELYRLAASGIHLRKNYHPAQDRCKVQIKKCWPDSYGNRITQVYKLESELNAIVRDQENTSLTQTELIHKLRELINKA